ncbi:MAG: zinc-binding dehydrogenase [Planctomycetota bacterium]|jgi:threonine dehydrogenase-like Zn-dependent dehydrogenase|nr:zinc-binding dehydrogenase [Planctomycetota bacterium]
MRGYGIKAVNVPGWVEKEKPVAGPLDAVLRPVLISPCTSDLHSMHGGAGPKEKDRIMGHEAVGEIVEIGSLVREFRVGEVVAVPCTTPDWLAPGVQGRFNAHDRSPLGSFKFLSQKDGVMAEFFHVNQADANLARIPEGVAPEAALMTVDMMSTGFYGSESADIGYGDTVVVVGIGPVGLMAVAGAELRGAGRIIAIGTRPNCVKAAREYGATDIVSYKQGDLVAQVLDLTGGRGADSVIVAGGGAETFGQAVRMCKAMGTVSNVNYFDAADILAMPAPAWGLGMADKTIRGGFCPGGRTRIEKLLGVVKYGRCDPARLITHVFEGFEKIEDATRLMEEKPADLIKPMVRIRW